MDGDQAAHGVGAHGGVGGLRGHADDIRKIEERRSVGLLAARKLEATCGAVRRADGIARRRAAVEFVGIVHRHHGVDGEPAKHHRARALKRAGGRP